MIFPRNVLKEINQYLQSPETVILTGMRRTGKTTILNFIQVHTVPQPIAVPNKPQVHTSKSVKLTHHDK